MSQPEPDRRRIRTYTILGLTGLLVLFVATVVVVLIRSPFPGKASGVVERIRHQR
jgi:hypothetical protein